MENTAVNSTATRSAFGQFMANVYGYMGIGVLITAMVSLFITNSEGLMAALFTVTETTNADGETMSRMSAGWVFWMAIIAELAIVVTISFGVSRLRASISWPLFLVFAVLNGITLTPIIHAYTGENVSLAFFMAVVVFGVAATYGHVTKRDITNLGGVLLVGLISLIVAMVINIFIGSSLMAMGISAIAVILFTILTAYDVQKFREMHAAQYGESEKSLAVFAALSMYLNLVNLFIHILRLLGMSGND